MTLEESDVDMILEICKQNATFYKCTEAHPTKGNILDDMEVTPPGIDLSNKYYFGFFNNQKLIAIMELGESDKHLQAEKEKAVAEAEDKGK